MSRTLCSRSSDALATFRSDLLASFYGLWRPQVPPKRREVLEIIRSRLYLCDNRYCSSPRNFKQIVKNCLKIYEISANMYFFPSHVPRSLHCRWRRHVFMLHWPRALLMMHCRNTHVNKMSASSTVTLLAMSDSCEFSNNTFICSHFPHFHREDSC